MNVGRGLNLFDYLWPLHINQLVTATNHLYYVTSQSLESVSTKDTLYKVFGCPLVVTITAHLSVLGTQAFNFANAYSALTLKERATTNYMTLDYCAIAEVWTLIWYSKHCLKSNPTFTNRHIHMKFIKIYIKQVFCDCLQQYAESYSS